MGGITPVYGIRYPNGSTKAKDLGLELGIMGSDIERALQAAEVVPVVPGQVIAAKTDAARDAYFGVPASEAARLALQDKGPLVVRTDKGGAIETYFATYNAASNPQGALTAGWQTIAGGTVAGTPFAFSDPLTIGAAGAPAYASASWVGFSSSGWTATAIRRLPGLVGFTGVTQRINNGAWPANELIFTLPPMWRPRVRSRLWGEASSVPVPITVETDGRVIAQNAGSGTIAFGGTITL